MDSLPQPYFSPRQNKINTAIWSILILCNLLGCLSIAQLGLRMEMENATDFYLITALMCGGIVALNIVYHLLPPTRALATLYGLANFLGQLIASISAIILLTYAGAWINFPLVDAPLVKIDALLGFDWPGFAQWMDGHVFLSSLLSIAYNSFNVQAILFTVLFFSYREFALAQRFLIIFLFAGLVTAALATLFPAEGPYIYYHIGSDYFQHVHSTVVTGNEEVFLGLRAHLLTALHFPLRGIVIFPSFHSVMAVLLIYAALPFHRLRFWLIFINLAMLFSTPVEGGHYLIDVVAGVGIAALAIALAEKLLPSSARA